MQAILAPRPAPLRPCAAGPAGGPIVRNKLHFFANYEYEHEPKTFIFNTPYPAFNIDMDGTDSQKKGGVRVTALDCSPAMITQLRLAAAPFGAAVEARVLAAEQLSQLDASVFDGAISTFAKLRNVPARLETARTTALVVGITALSVKAESARRVAAIMHGLLSDADLQARVLAAQDAALSRMVQAGAALRTRGTPTSAVDATNV